MAEVIQVEARRRGNAPAPDAQRDMQNVQRLAELLDTEFSLGGIRFGLDALIGLVPILGDSIALLIGLYPLYIAQQHRLGFFLRVRMFFNLALDWIIGLLPLIGDVADVGFKANIRNANLLRRAFEQRGNLRPKE